MIAADRVAFRFLSQTMSSEQPANFFVVNSTEQFQTLLSEDLNRVSLISFWAPWAEPCKQMNEVVLELAKKYTTVLTLQIEAESLPDIAESFDIEAVPSFVLLRGHTLLSRVSGADAAALHKEVSKHVPLPPPVVALSYTTQAPAPPPETVDDEETPDQLESRLRGLMTQSKVVLFMKGDPDQPRCGFSRKAVALLNEQNVPFTHFDILTDESVRAG
jgi:thioredoxin-like negative regulator of GroEL